MNMEIVIKPFRNLNSEYSKLHTESVKKMMLEISEDC